MTELDEAWTAVTSILTASGVDGVEKDKLLSNDACLSSVQRWVQILCDNDMHGILREWLLDDIQQQIGSQIAPLFWGYFKQPVPEKDVVTHITCAFNILYYDLIKFAPCFHRLNRIETISRELNEAQHLSKNDELNIHVQLRTILRGVIFYTTTRYFTEAMTTFLRRVFSAFDANFYTIDLDGSGADEDCEPLKCSGCGDEHDICQCKEVLHLFSCLVKQLKELDVLERVVAEPVMLLVHERIDRFVEAKCKANFDKNYVQEVVTWLDQRVIAWLEDLFKKALGSSETTIKLFPTHKDRLHYYICKVYGKLRISQLFNIIIEYPESEPALSDLAHCLDLVSDLRSLLVQSLKQALESRLLHPGVNTGDILTAYISTIRALRVLDSNGILLEMVGEPVKRYLRSRDDTVRCIVSSLTEDTNSELSDELIRGPPLMDDSLSSDDALHSIDWENWEPDPIDAEPFRQTQASRSSDIISMLVNIYGSKELFIDEYRSLLADRILTQFSYDTEKEIRHLELLKLRFGETQLHDCEVMLKDVADSRRINSHILESQQLKDEKKSDDEIPVNAMILSAQFWPARLRDEKVELPDCLKQSLSKYKKSYELLKGNRTLNWKPHLGLVSLEVELKEKVLTFNVTPVHATIIYHYQQKQRWTVDELSAVMQMPSQALQRKMAFWQSQGLLREEATDTFVLVEDHKGFSQEVMSIEEDEAESVLSSAQDQKEEELQIVWSYVVGMLTNLDSLAIDRMHSMLKMFAMHGPGSQCSLAELKAILDRRVKEQKLTYSNGLYRLSKH